MLNPLILQRVSLPQTRMWVNQFALPISLSGLMLGVFLKYYIFSIIYFLIAHSVLIYLTYRNPYFMEILFARIRFQGQCCSLQGNQTYEW